MFDAPCILICIRSMPCFYSIPQTNSLSPTPPCGLITILLLLLLKNQPPLPINSPSPTSIPTFTSCHHISTSSGTTMPPHPQSHSSVYMNDITLFPPLPIIPSHSESVSPTHPPPQVALCACMNHNHIWTSVRALSGQQTLHHPPTKRSEWDTLLPPTHHSSSSTAHATHSVAIHGMAWPRRLTLRRMLICVLILGCSLTSTSLTNNNKSHLPAYLNTHSSP